MNNETDNKKYQFSKWTKYVILKGLGIYIVDNVAVTPENADTAWESLKDMFNMG
jgi:hypothetical protein